MLLVETVERRCQITFVQIVRRESLITPTDVLRGQGHYRIVVHSQDLPLLNRNHLVARSARTVRCVAGALCGDIGSIHLRVVFQYNRNGMAEIQTTISNPWGGGAMRAHINTRSRDIVIGWQSITPILCSLRAGIESYCCSISGWSFHFPFLSIEFDLHCL